MITIWHNPRCSKSRQTLALIEDSGAAVTVRKYLEDAPTAAEIENALSKLDMTAAQIVRFSEKQAKDLGLTKSTDAATLIAEMARHPILIERPIVISVDKAVLGRPPENVQALL
jgi:arsenate reductase